MLSQRLSMGLKLLLGLLPIYYSAILVIALPNTWQWLIVIGVGLVALLLLCISLDYPLQVIWPVFPGAILILACSFALYQGAWTELPLTRQPGELLVMYVVGALYIAWAIRATWRSYSAY